MHAGDGVVLDHTSLLDMYESHTLGVGAGSDVGGGGSARGATGSGGTDIRKAKNLERYFLPFEGATPAASKFAGEDGAVVA
jgi:hypothetical protein